MQNIHLLGLRHADQFNLRITFFVIAIFSFITIISYFNELAKAGLLKKQYGHYPEAKHREFRSVDHIPSTTPDINYKYEMQNALIRNQGNTQELRLDIKQVKKAYKRNNSNDTINEENKPINIAIRLGHNTSYVTLNNTKVKIYHHNNALPNFFLSLPSNLTSRLDCLQNQSDDLVAIETQLEKLQLSYHNATHVLLYQYEPIGYMLRNCFKKIAVQKKLNVPKVPLSKDNRKDWEMITKEKKNTFHVLYGSMAFGVCESISRPCLYFLLLQHPLDRILTIFSLCRHNSSQPSCHVNLLSNTSVTLRQFIKSQGSKLAQELMYFSRHCRLVGDDEVCLPDTKTSFILNSNERREHLKYTVTNIERWFSVVGLESHIDDSIAMFRSVLGHDFTPCMSPPCGNRSISTLLPGVKNVSQAVQTLLQNQRAQEILYETLSLYLNDSQSDKVLENDHLEKLFLTMSQSPMALHQIDESERLSYLILREKLLSDPEVHKWINPDLTIYKKVEELFFKQRDTFKRMQHLKQMLKPKVFQKKPTKGDGEDSHSLRHSGTTHKNDPYTLPSTKKDKLPQKKMLESENSRGNISHIHSASHPNKSTLNSNKQHKKFEKRHNHGVAAADPSINAQKNPSVVKPDVQVARRKTDHNRGTARRPQHSDYSWSKKKKVSKVLHEMVEKHQEEQVRDRKHVTVAVPTRVGHSKRRHT